MRFETTIQRPVEASGVGLHSGVPFVFVLSLPAGTGIVFVRTDLDGFTIPASWRHVRGQLRHQPDAAGRADLDHRAPAERVLQHGHRQRFVEIDNLEVPILDGSGQPFVELIREAGIRTTAAPAQVSADPAAGVGGGARQAHQHSAGRPFPLDLRRRLDHPLVGRQTLEMEVTPGALRGGDRLRAHVRLRVRARTRCATWG